MSSAATPSTPLPVRTPGSRARGRHRRPERPEIPAGAPALLLAVPGEPTSSTQQIADELVSLVRAEQPGIDVTAVYLVADQALDAVPAAQAPAEGDAPTEGDAQDGDVPAAVFGTEPAGPPSLAAALARAAEAGAAVPVVVPLLPGPNTAFDLALADLGGGITTTDPLGPHPLLAEALHVRLSEAGLARADRARLFAVNTAADGIVLATVGGPEALQFAEVTGVLLAARLAVPVVAATLDEPGSVAAAATHLRETGCGQPALAPYLIGPEVDADLLKSVAAETDCPAAETLGAYPTIARLVLGLYLGAIGVERDADLT
ncbi:sirohydrochlorin chelatase [Streptacidiphilus albus]|uniref:sirohydrochlorin chelatase n=1 Tax=Streptacidiphilus albus TaxID=105425 RepID=UPI0009DF1629|nr:hypothetical protein [Streptacidiphilus albus]